MCKKNLQKYSVKRKVSIQVTTNTKFNLYYVSVKAQKKIGLFKESP
jgi:hypothetical protein